MKKQNKHIVRPLLSVLILALFGIAACEEEDFRILPDEETLQTIISIEPVMADIGTTVTITGTNFSPVPANNKVSFNGTGANVVSASETTLVTVVPEGATTGPVSVFKVTQVDGPVFTVVLAPVITDLSTTGAPVGETVIITGANFGTTANENTVSFNGVEATINEASETRLEVTVPEGATTGPLTVEFLGQTNGTEVIFTVAPEITGFSPESGAFGTEVTITGTNFNADSENVQVTINGAIASIVSASTTELIVEVPAEGTSGPLSIEIETLLANSPTDFITIPSISSIAPASASEGTEVTISGANFGLDAISLEVLFDTSVADIVESTFNSITAIVPNGLAIGATNVTVSLDGQISEPMEFTVVEAIPLTTFGFTSFEEVPTFDPIDNGDGTFSAQRYPRPAASQDPMPNIQDTDLSSELPYVAFSGGISELGFTAAFEAGSVTDIEDERLGVYNNTSINAEIDNFGALFEDGVQGYVTSDLDGTLTLRFDTMTNLNSSITQAVLEARVYFRETTWEDGDGIEIFFETADGLGDPIISLLAGDVEAIAGQSTLISVPFPTEKLQQGRLVVTFTNGAGSETASLDYIAIKGVP
ncbi:MAG: IPT/TIG domain-containing protein [Bacteroidota bacterium]